MAGAGQSQVLSCKRGSTTDRNRRLKRLGGGSEIKVTVDVTVPRNQLAGTAYNCDRTVVKGLHQARADLLGEHGVLGAEGWVAQVVLVSTDYRGLELIKHDLNLLADCRYFCFHLPQLC